MLHLLISCDDDMERLLYGEPDPWLRQFECRHRDITISYNDDGSYGGAVSRPHPHPHETEDDDRTEGTAWDFDQTSEENERREQERQGLIAPDAPGSDLAVQGLDHDDQSSDTDNRVPDTDNRVPDWLSHQVSQEQWQEYSDDFRQVILDRREEWEWRESNSDVPEWLAGSISQEEWSGYSNADRRALLAQEQGRLTGEQLETALAAAAPDDLGTVAASLVTQAVQAGDFATLRRMVFHEDLADLTFTYTDADGVKQQLSARRYILNVAIPRVRSTSPGGAVTAENAPSAWNLDLGRRNSALAVLNDPYATPAELLAAADTLNGLADVYQDTGLTLQVDHDGDPDTLSQPTPAADWLRKVADSAAITASTRTVEQLSEADDIAGLQELANDPASASQTVTITGDDGEPKEITLAEYITEHAIPAERGEARIDSIGQLTETDDIEGLQQLANHPESASQTVTITGEDGQPKEITLAEYITEHAIPAERQQQAVETDVNRLQRVADKLDGMTGSRYLNTATSITRAYEKAAEKYRTSAPELASYFDGQAQYYAYLGGRRRADSSEDAERYRTKRANYTASMERAASIERAVEASLPNILSKASEDTSPSPTTPSPLNDEYIQQLDLPGAQARTDEAQENYNQAYRDYEASITNKGYADESFDEAASRRLYQTQRALQDAQAAQYIAESQLLDYQRGDGLSTATDKAVKAQKTMTRQRDRDDNDDGSGGGSREYTVADDGAVSFVEDGKTYQVSDDDLAQGVREAAASGDASGLTGTQEQVTVSTGDGGPVAAANYNVGGEASEGNYGSLRDSQEAWFREQLANLPDDPAEAAARLTELSARADELNAEWQGRDATFVGPDGQPITGAEYFAQVSASLSAGANENTVIANRNAALPEAVAPVTTTSQPNAGLGDRLNADKAAIDERVAAANAVEDPAERAEALAALASDIRDLQEQWTGADTQGWTLGVDHDNDPDTPRLPTTASEWWGDYAAGIEATADANRGAAAANRAQQVELLHSQGVDTSEMTDAEIAALAQPVFDSAQRQYQRDQAAVVAQQVELLHSQGVDTSEMTDAEIAALAQPVFDSAQRQYQRDQAAVVAQQVELLHSQGVDTSEMTDAEIAALAQPVFDSAQRQYQRDQAAVVAQQVELLHSQGVDTSEMTDAEIAALAQPVFDSAQRQASRARVETREAVENVIGEVEGPITQEHVDQANRVIGIDNERLERQAFQARVETREAVESVIGEVEGPITQEHVDQANRIIGIDNERLERQAFQARVETREAVESVIGEVEGPITQEHVDQANRVIEIDNDRVAREQEGDLDLIGGNLGRPLDLDTLERLKGSAAAIRKESEGGGVASDPANLEAQQTRLDRINNGEIFTIDDVKAANPGISDEDAKERVVYEAVLDIFTGNLTDDIGSIEFYNALRSRGFNPVAAGHYSKKAHDEGLTTITDTVAVVGAIAGGYAGAYAAGRVVPVISRGINPRLTTGIGRGAVEEVGEESGELIADVIHTAVTGGNPVAILLDPSTYAYAGGSILFSSVAEADAPRVRPRPETVPDGAVGTGAVHSLGGSVDPAIAAEGNRLLDRRAASRQELGKYLKDPPPEGIDSKTWNLRGQALARDVAKADADLTDFRLRNPDLVVGYKSGGTLTATTATNLIAVAPPDGNIRIYTLSPGEAQFVPSPREATDAILPNGRSNADPNDAGNVNNDFPIQPSGVPVVDSSAVETPVLATIPTAALSEPLPLGQAEPAPQTTPTPTPTEVDSSAVETSVVVAPVPTSALSEPLPLGQAEPAPQTTPTPTPTETEGQGDSRDGRSAPPGVIDPGVPSFTPPPSPQPLPQPSTAPQASLAPSPQPSPTPSITPTPNPDPGTQSQPIPVPTVRPPQPFGTPTASDPTPAIIPAPAPAPAPTTQPIPVPTVRPPQPFGTPSAVGQPTESDPTPAIIPDVTPTPTPTTETQPGTQPQPEPSITPTITTTETPTITPTRRPRPRRRGRGDDETPRRREIPNPVADDPNRHPNEVQFVEPVLHTVDLVTGDHTIQPLDDEQLRTIQITGFGPENPQGNVHLAGSVQLEVERQHIVAESADRRKDAGDPIDYREINFLPGQGPSRPSAEDLSRIQLRQSPGQLDKRDINFLPGQGPSRPSAQDLSRIQLQDQRNQGEGQQLDYRDINFVDRERGGRTPRRSRLRPDAAAIPLAETPATAARSTTGPARVLLLLGAAGRPTTRPPDS